MEGKYLITTDDWFFAPDGQQYKAVWGNVEIVSDAFLGVKTNYRSANWFAKVGTDDNHVIVAGCQIHYAIKSSKRPSEQPLKTENIHDGVQIESFVSSRIYFSE